MFPCAHSHASRIFDGVRLDVAPPAARATYKRVRSDLLKVLDSVAASQQLLRRRLKMPSPLSAKGNRGGCALSKPSLDLRMSAQPPDSQRDLDSLILGLELLAGPFGAVGSFAHVACEGNSKNLDPFLALVEFQVDDAWILGVRRPDDRTPRGQEYLGGAGRGGDSSEGTTFVAAEASDADNGGIFSWQRAWFMADWISAASQGGVGSP